MQEDLRREPPVTTIHYTPTGKEEENVDQKDPNTETFEGDFIYKPYQKVKTLPLPLRIHLSIGISICVLCFFIWRWVSYDINSAPWWFIFPMFFFAMTVSFHKYVIVDGAVYPESKIKGVYVIIGLINLLLFFANFLMGPSVNPYPWFIYPLFGSIMVSLYIYHRQNPDTYSFLKLLTHEYLIFNLLLFITWLLSRGFPWFFYPLLILAYPLLTLYVKKVYKENRHTIFVLILSVDICLICFITWVFTDFWFPWFLFVWAILGAATFFLWKNAKQTSEYLGIDKSSQPPKTEQQVNEQKEEDKYTNLYPNV